MSEFSRSCRPMLRILGLPPRSEGRLAVAVANCVMSGYGMAACGGKVDVRGLGSKVCRGPPVHRPSLHSRYRFAAADPGPLVRRALLDICAVKSSILERSSLRIGEVFALL